MLVGWLGSQTKQEIQTEKIKTAEVDLTVQFKTRMGSNRQDVIGRARALAPAPSNVIMYNARPCFYYFLLYIINIEQSKFFLLHWI